MPSARSSGTAIGRSKDSSRTCGQRSRTSRRVASSVQSATTTSASGAFACSEARHSPRYGMPLTEATTTESAGSAMLPEGVEMPARLPRRPGGVEPDDERQRGEGATAETAAELCLAQDPERHERRHEWRADDPREVAGAPEAGPALTPVGASVLEALAGERRGAGGAALADDELGRVPQACPVGAEPPVDVGLPEPVAVERPRLLERRARVGGVVAREVDALVTLEGKHVARVAAEVLRPVREPEIRGGVDRAGHRLSVPGEPADRLDPVGRRPHRRDGQRPHPPRARADPAPPKPRPRAPFADGEAGQREPPPPPGRARPRTP